ncbi:peptidase C45 acyl-coenzyme A:6-aminopenicillanic acid acyl-transferase [Salinisphaera sp. C84B14]
MGAAHGRRYRDAIQHFAGERTRMLGSAYWVGRELEREAVLDMAAQCLPAHERLDPALTDELRAMADAAGLDIAELLVVSGFTDLVDTVYNNPANTLAAPAPRAADQCTAMLVPGQCCTDGNALFAQTWDMHESAAEHVVMIDGRPDDAPAFTAFTSMGCPGMIGMNEHGITVGINNLVAVDGQPGVTWNFVVRAILRQSNIEDALACITATPLAGAHNYLMLDANGRGFNVEAMPSRHAITPLEDRPVVHTNHCLTEATQAVERQRLPGSQASSEKRLARAKALLDDTSSHDIDTLAAITRDPEAICVQATPKVREATCGAVIADPAKRTLWALRGLPSEQQYEPFRLAD